MKYSVYFWLILILYSCGPPLQYYRFKVTTFPYPRYTADTVAPDSTLVVKALTWADASNLLPQDWNQLKNYAKEHQLVLKTEKKKIYVEKYEKPPANKDDVDTKAKTTARDLKDMKLTGTGTNSKFVRALVFLAIGIGLFFLVGYLVMLATINEAEETFCYIATVCYGDPYASEVVDLKRFRDQVMKKYFIGRVLVRFYYMISPSIAKFLKGKDSINYCIRRFILNPIVFLVRRKIALLPSGFLVGINNKLM